MLSDSARTISYYVDAGRTAANALPRRGLSALRRPVRRPLDEGVIEYAGEVILARDACRSAIPAWCCGWPPPRRPPAADRRVDAGPARRTAPELRARGRAMRSTTCWCCWAAGPTAVATVEALDRTGLWGRLFPELGAVRDLPPRDASTSGPSTATSSKPSPGQALSPPGCLDPTCWCLCAVPRHRQGARGNHSVIGAELAIQVCYAAGAVALRRRTALGQWCVIICCCPIPPPAATCRIRRPSADVVHARLTATGAAGAARMP